MPRGADTWGSLGAALARVLSGERPAWVRPATAAQLEATLAALRADALARVEDASTYEAPQMLEVGRTLYMAARAPGGWLSTVRPNATLAEVWTATPSPPPRRGAAASPKRAGGRRP